MRLWIWWLLLITTSPSSAETIEVYVSQGDQLIGVPSSYQGNRIRVYEIDAVFALEDTWSNALPNDENAAHALIQRRLRGNEARFAKEVIEAWQIVVRAHNAGISFVPAVVFDRRYVVYGERDFARAARYYEALPK